MGFDALCHNIEVFTANNAQPLTDAMAQYAIPLIWENLPKAYEGNMSDEVWESLCMGSTIGGMVINTAGVTLAHGMEHPVSGLKNVVHGVGLAAIEPIAVEATCRANRFKFGKAARLMGGLTAEDCGPRLRSLTRRLNMDVTLAGPGRKGRGHSLACRELPEGFGRQPGKHARLRGRKQQGGVGSAVPPDDEWTRIRRAPRRRWL